MIFKRRRGRKPKCIYPDCRSSSTISKGVRKTETLGIRKLRVCRDCNRKFTVGRVIQRSQRKTTNTLPKTPTDTNTEIRSIP